MLQRPDATIFRAYDIRGIVGRDLTAPIYEVLGRAVATYLQRSGRRSIAVGRDARLTSPEFQAALIAGLRAGGMEVVDIGQVATPVMYFAVEQLKLDAGAVVSASHNPPQFNGLKLRLSDPQHGSTPVPSEDIQVLSAIARGDAAEWSSGNGSLQQADVSAAYIANVTAVLPHFSGAKRPKVVLDGGNGVAGPLGLAALQALGLDVVPLFIEPDGTFPNHHPDPLKPENMVDLGRAVREHGAQLGIGLDGDGDRLGIVDETGAMVFADRYLIAMATHALAARKGAVVFDVKCSAVLPEAISALGGTPVMWKTGYTNLSAKMRELDAVLGGELSGHTILPLPGHYYDDGAFAGAALLAALDSMGTTSRAALAPFPDRPSLDEGRIEFDEALKFKAIEHIQAHYHGRLPLLDVDGVRVDFGDGWGLIRASNTEPAITTRFEALSSERATAIRDEMMAVLAEFRRAHGA